MQKNKVYVYKENCVPRVLINPSKEVIEDLSEDCVVLINPNMSSDVKKIPLQYTYPDEKSNCIKKLPSNEIKVLEKPNKVEMKQFTIDKVSQLEQGILDLNEYLGEVLILGKEESVVREEGDLNLSLGIDSLKEECDSLNEGVSLLEYKLPQLKKELSKEVSKVDGNLCDLHDEVDDKFLQVEIEKEELKKELEDKLSKQINEVSILSTVSDKELVKCIEKLSDHVDNVSLNASQERLSLEVELKERLKDEDKDTLKRSVLCNSLILAIFAYREELFDLVYKLISLI